MAGEVQAAHLHRRPQPGGRAPAPGSLAVVQAFIDSHYDLQRALVVREGLRALARGGAAPWERSRLDEAARGARVTGSRDVRVLALGPLGITVRGENGRT